MSALRGSHGRRRSRSGNDSYYVSLVDLLIGLIFIFILLLVASALSAKRLQFELDERPQLRLRLLKNLQDDMAKHGVHVIVDGGNGILRLPEDALFASGAADIDVAGRLQLDRDCEPGRRLQPHPPAVRRRNRRH